MGPGEMLYSKSLALTTHLLVLLNTFPEFRLHAAALLVVNWLCRPHAPVIISDRWQIRIRLNRVRSVLAAVVIHELTLNDGVLLDMVIGGEKKIIVQTPPVARFPPLPLGDRSW